MTINSLQITTTEYNFIIIQIMGAEHGNKTHSLVYDYKS